MAEISTEQLLQELTNLRESNEQRQDSLIDFLYGNNGVAMESLGDLPRIFLEEGEKNRQSLAEEITNSLTTLSKDFNGVSLSILDTQINNTNLLKTSIDKQIASVENQSVMIGLLSSVLEKDIEVNPLIQLDSESSSVLEKDTEVNPLIQPNSESSQIVEQLNEANLSLIDIWNTNDQLAGQTLANQSVMVGLLSDIDKKLEKPDDFDASLSKVGGKTGTGIEVSTMDGGNSGEVLSAIGGAVAEFGDPKTKEGADGLLAVSGALVVAAGALVIFNYVEWGSLVKAGLALGGLIATLHLVDKKTISGAKALAIAGASLAIAAGGLMLFNYVDFSSVIEGSIAIGVLTFALSKIPTNAIAGAGALAIMGGALAIAAIGFKVMSEIPLEGWGSVIIGAGALTVFGIAMAALGAGPQAVAVAAGAGALIAMGAGMVVSAFGLKMFSEIEPDSWSNIMAGALPLLAIGGTMAALGLVAMPIALGSVALSAMGVSFLVAAEGLQAFSEVNWVGVGEGAVNLALIGMTVSGLGLAIIPIGLGVWSLNMMGDALGNFARNVQPLLNADFNWGSKLSILFKKLVGDDGAFDQLPNPISMKWKMSSLSMMGDAMRKIVPSLVNLGKVDWSNISLASTYLKGVLGTFATVGSDIDEDDFEVFEDIGKYIEPFAKAFSGLGGVDVSGFTDGVNGILRLTKVKDTTNVEALAVSLQDLFTAISGTDISNTAPHLESFASGVSALSVVDAEGLSNVSWPLAKVFWSLSQLKGVEISDNYGESLKSLADGVSALSIVDAEGLSNVSWPLRRALWNLSLVKDLELSSDYGEKVEALARGVSTLSMVDAEGLSNVSWPLRKALWSLSKVKDIEFSGEDATKLKTMGEFAQMLSAVDGSNLEIVSKALANIDFPMLTIKHQLDKNSGQITQDEKISNALDTIISLLTNGNNKSDEITEALDTIAKINKDGTQQTATTVIDASRDYPGALQTADKAFI